MTERLAQILADSFFKILIPGITVTIPLTALSFSISLVISVAVALVQFAQVPVLTKLARLYIWIIRGTPHSGAAVCSVLRPAGRRHPH